MPDKTPHAIVAAAIVVALAATLGIAAIQGWLPAWPAGSTPASIAAPGQMVAGTAPADSLSPGEAVVTLPESGKPAVPAPPAPQPAQPPDPKPGAPAARTSTPGPKTPGYARSVAPGRAPEVDTSRDVCTNCGTVSATTFRQDMNRGVEWEVRVQFDDGRRRILRFPTDPGFRTGERVYF